MGAAASPGPWEWPPLQDRIWTNPAVAAAPADAALATALDDLHIDSRPLSEDALRASLDQLHALTRAQPSPHAELDLAPSPVSLRPHPDQRQAFAAHRTLSEESLALNLPHELARLPPPRRLPHSALASYAPHHAYSDPALHMSSLHYPYAPQPAPLLPDQLAPLSAPPPDTPAGRKGRSATRSAPRIKNELYKTEICRSYSQTGGFCKYGAKCQFAHGDRERRPVRRHPRYKTKLCRNFVTTGHCPYGSRCRFIHANDLRSDAKELIDFGMLAALPEAASFSPALARAHRPPHSAHDLLSSDSQSTSPDHSQRHSFDINELRMGYGAGRGSRPSNLSVSHDLLPDLPRSAPLPASSLTPTEYAAASSAPLQTFALAAETVDPGPSLSPSAGRSRLPVFQTLSDSFTADFTGAAK